MDRGGIGISALTPKRRYSSSSRKSGLLGSARRQSLKLGSSIKSVQSNQVLFRSQHHVVEGFGTSLPVLVREALTFTEKNVTVSARVSNEGWAWLVCGRRLLVWQCNQVVEDGRRRVINNQCRELTLPSSDLAYRAELVVIFTLTGNQVPSCIAVSPEGIVRYWPNIGHEGSSVEVNADLQGQECDSLTDISPIGCILATTTATIVLVQPQMNNGRHSAVCRPLKLPQGWLGGISRLIPSLIFGSLQSSHILETKLIKVTAVKGQGYESQEWTLFILSGHTLQKWILVNGETERLVYECDINRFAIEAFQLLNSAILFISAIREPCGGIPNETQVWLLDMQPTDGGVVILIGVTNAQISPQLYYALGTLHTDSLTPPTRFDRFCPLKVSGFYRESDEPELLSYRFLLNGTSALLYKSKSVVAVSATNLGEECDNIEFLSQNDEILGAALCRSTPVFFTKDHGLVSILSWDAARPDFSNISVSDLATVDPSSTSVLSEHLNMTITDIELEDMSLKQDSVTQMKAAFLYFIRRNVETAEAMVKSLFPYEEESAMVIDAPLDIVVTKVSLDLINDVPAGDPRWAAVRTSETSLGSSTSLQILNQLEDKQRALEWFFAFLREVKLWNRLAAVAIRETVMATTLVLCEHSEKIVAAISLKNLHSSHGSLIDQCIKQVIGQEKPEHGLSHQDLFYRDVSRISEGLKTITEWSESLAHSDRRPQEIAFALSDANTILLTVLREVIQWRQQKTESFSPKGSFLPQSCEYLPWTAAPGQDGLRDPLTLQHSLTLKYGARITGEVELKSQFYEQLVNLTDIILDGRRSHIDSLQGKPKYESLNHQYETNRLSIIKPFLADGEYERAAMLAEKYLDFHILIQICELTDNIDRLDNYCEKYSEQNFSQFLFNWYLRERKPGRLLEQFRSRSKPQKQKRELSHFLNDHPSLSWLQDIFSQEYKQASETLHSLARQEVELLNRKKVMLSLSKLAILASDEDEHVLEDKLSEFDSELNLVSHEEDLPENVLVAYGYDVSKLRVLNPSELIKLYISIENENGSEVDFKKALDLLNYIEDEIERNELRHMIWCNAILRDSWKEIDPDSSIDNILNLLFFKLVDLVEFMGENIDDLLPPIDRILEAEELGDLRHDRHFQYLIRVGYEHFMKNPENCGDFQDA